MQEQKPKKQKQQIRVPQLAVSKRFGKYKPEEKKEERKVRVKENEALDHLKEAWQTYRCRFHSIHPYSSGFLDIVNGPYSKALSKVSSLHYSALDAERFSVLLSGFQDDQLICEKTGLFLSALINNGIGDSFHVFTRQLDHKPFFMGYLNGKIIEVEGGCGNYLGVGMQNGGILVDGDVGDSIGCGMKNGKIEIMGNAANDVGYVSPYQWMAQPLLMQGGTIVVHGNVGDRIGIGMKNGKIIIKGNAGDHVGAAMRGGEIIIEGDVKDDLGVFFDFGHVNAGTGMRMWMVGGTITVRGNAGENVGQLMGGGEIHVEGEIGSIGNVIHGKIFHKGKLIVDK